MEELLKENNGTLIYASSAQAMLGMETSSYDSGGLYYPIENFCPDVRPVILASGVHLESLTMADPAGPAIRYGKGSFVTAEGFGCGQKLFANAAGIYRCVIISGVHGSSD